MQRLIVLAIAVLLVAFVQGQSGPQKAVQSCFTLSTSEAQNLFCKDVVTYPIPTGYDFVSKDFGARDHHQQTVAQIPGADANCQNNLKTYYCQYNFPRCGPYKNYTDVAVAKCASVVSSCNITAFPGTFVGRPCVNNTLITVDNPAICVPRRVATGLGQPCGFPNTFSPVVIPPTTVEVVGCPNTANCNNVLSGSEFGTCVQSSQLGSACNTTCVQATFLPSENPLTCIGGNCRFGGKRNNAVCVANGECLSNVCTAGRCVEQGLFGPCTSNAQCQSGLYCDSFNSTCYAVAGRNEACGQLQVNWDPVPCAAAHTCVRPVNSNATATCQPNALLGGACAVQSAAVVYSAPLCSNTIAVTSGTVQCLNGQCTNVQPAALDQACSAQVRCAQNLVCQFDSPTSAGGFCKQPGVVKCDTNEGAANCNAFQTCNCGSGLNAQGTCAVDISNPYATCAAQRRDLNLCISNSCPTNAAYYPYDGQSCVDAQCRPQINAYFCCVKSTVGTGFVPLVGQPTDPCIGTPTPTPTPTNPSTTSGPATSTIAPTTSPKRSGVAPLAVSFIALILAVVAFL